MFNPLTEKPPKKTIFRSMNGVQMMGEDLALADCAGPVYEFTPWTLYKWGRRGDNPIVRQLGFADRERGRYVSV